MKFPNKKYQTAIDFNNDYKKSFDEAFETINFKKLDKIIKILDKAYKNSKKKILVCGNGGSAALANHFACDHQKIIYETGKIKPFIISLSSNNSLITAISNDNDYSMVFSDQIKQIGSKGDILIVISSSGKSKNIINAIKVAKKLSIKTISFTGFTGGTTKKISDLNIHINSNNYGIIESMHHNLMNLISQYIKHKVISKNKIKKTIFLKYDLLLHINLFF